MFIELSFLYFFVYLLLESFSFYIWSYQIWIIFKHKMGKIVTVNGATEMKVNYGLAEKEPDCLGCRAAIWNKKWLTSFGGGIYRTPVSSLVRQDLCCMQILLPKRSKDVFLFSADSQFDRWMADRTSKQASEVKWWGDLITWRVKTNH